MKGSVTRCSPVARSSTKEEAVAAGLREQLAGLALEIGIESDGCLHSVPVMDIVRRGLEIPDKLPGVGIERNNGARVRGCRPGGIHRRERDWDCRCPNTKG